MGRNKIDIAKIIDISKRKVTFRKRLEGLIKKIYELGVLTDAHFVFAIKDEFTNVYRFKNTSEDLLKCPNATDYSYPPKLSSISFLPPSEPLNSFGQLQSANQNQTLWQVSQNQVSEAPITAHQAHLLNLVPQARAFNVAQQSYEVNLLPQDQPLNLAQAQTQSLNSAPQGQAVNLAQILGLSQNFIQIQPDVYSDTVYSYMANQQQSLLVGQSHTHSQEKSPSPTPTSSDIRSSLASTPSPHSMAVLNGMTVKSDHLLPSSVYTHMAPNQLPFASLDYSIQQNDTTWPSQNDNQFTELNNDNNQRPVGPKEPNYSTDDINGNGPLQELENDNIDFDEFLNDLEETIEVNQDEQKACPMAEGIPGIQWLTLAKKFYCVKAPCFVK